MDWDDVLDWLFGLACVLVLILAVVGVIFGIRALGHHIEHSSDKFINDCIAAHYVVVPGGGGRLYCLPPENAPGYVKVPG